MKAFAHTLVLGLLWLTFGSPVAAEPVDAMARGRQLTRLFFTNQLDSLHQTFNTQMGQFMSVEKLEIFSRQVDVQLGKEKNVIEEKVESRDSIQVYRRLANFEKYNGLIEIMWGLDPRGQADAFYVRPPSQAHASKYLEYQTKTPLRLPFDGAWFVFWGGRRVEENHHAVAPDQRFAYDIVMRQGVVSHSGAGQSNEQYYAFGRAILAPGAGKILAAVDGIADNKPGEMNREQPLGNHVIIDHGNGEFSFLAHLKQGSVVVKAGQTVKPGDKLGLCGNTGNSSEPHLHYHMQTTGVPFKGDGLPAQFLGYLADGQKVDRGEPHQMQTVQQP